MRFVYYLMWNLETLLHIIGIRGFTNSIYTYINAKNNNTYLMNTNSPQRSSGTHFGGIQLLMGTKKGNGSGGNEKNNYLRSYGVPTK